MMPYKRFAMIRGRILFVVNVAAFCRGFQLYGFVVIFCASVLAFGEGNPPPEVPVDSWFNGPERQDFPWRVEVGQSWLTFQQRRYVQTAVRFRVRDLLKANVSLRDLHLVVKLVGEDGRWLPGLSYSRFEPPADLALGDEIHSICNLYVRQGNYKVAVMAFDAAHRRGNLWRGTANQAEPQ